MININDSLSIQELENFLEKQVEAVLSSRRTAREPAELLFKLKPSQQKFALEWVEIVASSNAEMGYQFAQYVRQVLEVLEEDAVKEWAVKAMDVYDRLGLLPAVSELQNIDKFVRYWSIKRSGVFFNDVRKILETMIQGLNGRSLNIEPSQEIYTDTETLFLPKQINRFPNYDDNYLLYKATACNLWAQTWFGTWKISIQEKLSQFKNQEKALKIFHILETIRLNSCIKRELPGLHRNMIYLMNKSENNKIPEHWVQLIPSLQEKHSTVETTCNLLHRFYEESLDLDFCFQGELFPDRVEAIKQNRIEKEKNSFRIALIQLAKNKDIKSLQKPIQLVPDLENIKRFEVNKSDESPLEKDMSYDLFLDGQPIIPPEDIQNLMESIIQDIDEIPEEYLNPAGSSHVYNKEFEANQKSLNVFKTQKKEENTFLYDEWDYKRQHYRKKWCVVKEVDIEPWYNDFPLRTVEKYNTLIKSLRRTFEALRGEDKLLKRQYHGDDVDIDALVEAYADVKNGLEMSDRLFTKMFRVERNIAVLFMVDMSGSTKGWINTAEREALILLCETLETLGDRYAIYGFSGTTRKKCEIYKIKEFEESYDKVVKGRISGIEPKDYTRMGVAIRHLSKILLDVDAKTKLLISLSDGKPEDYDGYRGKYGIEDTRKALIESKRQGIHSFCITLDLEANDYLPHMYGSVNYAVIDNVRKLPLKVSDIYRKITT